MRFGLDNPDQYRLAFRLWDARHKAGLASAEKPSAVGMQAFATLDRLVAEGIATGVFRAAGGPARGTAEALWATIHRLGARLIAHPISAGWKPINRSKRIPRYCCKGLVAPGLRTPASRRSPGRRKSSRHQPDRGGCSLKPVRQRMHTPPDPPRCSPQRVWFLISRLRSLAPRIGSSAIRHSPTRPPRHDIRHVQQVSDRQTQQP
jgi:hypothetical protein